MESIGDDRDYLAATVGFGAARPGKVVYAMERRSFDTCEISEIVSRSPAGGKAVRLGDRAAS